MQESTLKLVVSAPRDTYVVSEPFTLEYKLANDGPSSLYLYRYGFEIGLQLEIEAVDKGGNTVLIPPQKDIEPDLSRENFFELRPGEIFAASDDISPILRAGLIKTGREIYITISYSSKYYGEYAKKMYQINAFDGTSVSNQLRIKLRRTRKIGRHGTRNPHSGGR